MNLDELYRKELPDPNLADPSGLLFLSEGFSPELSIAACMKGIFPWTDDGTVVGWYSPVVRSVITIETAHVPRRVLRYLRTSNYQIKTDHRPKEVIYMCSQIPRSDSEASWITSKFIEHYSNLVDLGYVSSVEVWQDRLLVGGVFGLRIRDVFFGESMFSLVDSASSLAMSYLIEQVQAKELSLIDCQVSSAHLHRFGAVDIPRREFLKVLKTIFDIRLA